MGDDVERVRVADLKVGDEVEGYGTVTWLGMVLVPERRVTFHPAGGAASVKEGHSWPSEALVPVVQRPRRWKRTVEFIADDEDAVRSAERGVIAWLAAGSGRVANIGTAVEVTEVDA